MCYFVYFQGTAQKRGHKLRFELMENAKENTIYNNLLSNTGCYEHIGPSLPSLDRLFAEAACSSAPAQPTVPIPIGLSISHLRSGLSLQDIPLH